MTVLPRRLEVLREIFNAEIQHATKDGIEPAELIALAGALAEDLIMALPKRFREIGVECVIERMPENVRERTAAGE